MTQRIITLITLLIALLFNSSTTAALFNGDSASARFLPQDKAFSFDFQQNGDRMILQWRIHNGYYLYRQQIKLAVNGATMDNAELPSGEMHHDEFFGDSQIYRQSLTLSVPLHNVTPGATLSISYQGCAAAGFCYPPEKRSLPLSTVTVTVPSHHAPALPFSPLWALFIGIGVAFTPCVLPMYPLISSIILGQEKLSVGRTLLLAAVYVQGMAVTYTLLGLMVSASGLRFQAFLQHPYVLAGLSVLFILLALSMFGVYQLQLPAALQTRIAGWANRQRSGSLAGVLAMGTLAGLICTPCTTAPLSALLLYIAQSGNLLSGGGTLYLYALGMGLPLIVVTLFGRRMLPESGPWMQYIKEGFGFVILALPVFLLARVFNDWEERLWSALGTAFLVWAFVLTLRSHTGWIRALQIILLTGALVIARPLQDWLFSPPQPPLQTSDRTIFTPIRNLNELRSAFPSTSAVTMLDLYADWCVACKEFDKYTFHDAGVQRSLASVRLLKADVTADNVSQNALLQQYQVLGLPSILFFDANGQEIPGSRVTGFLDATQFQAHLKTLER